MRHRATRTVIGVSPGGANSHFVLAEMVLAELLSAFRFEDAGKPVVWNIGEVVYPTVGQESTVPAFPMKVTAL